MAELTSVTPIKALQATSAETEFEGDSGTFCCSHGKKVNSVQEEEEEEEEEGDALHGTRRKREQSYFA
jgi:hypothetical protein